MTNVQTVYDFLQEKAPFELQLGFDNAGFLVGRRDAAVSRILVSLDITEPVIQEAVERKAQLIVSHHPVIWGGRQVGHRPDSYRAQAAGSGGKPYCRHLRPHQS